jgi:glycosyltransferase involved in cell wall biosynthesis
VITSLIKGHSCAHSSVELTILMPCLNEAETIRTCIDKARGYLQSRGITGEVLIADNGSSDGSQKIAVEAGARVVDISTKGYGAALRGGIAHAQGDYVIMGDADDSYDFSALDLFVEQLRAGMQLVMGNRFRGGIKPGAMPPLHRYLGNPVLSFIGRLFYKIDIGDFHCGLRGFNRRDINALHLSSPGMEFASEMVVKAAINKLKIAEVPTILSKDGRSRAPHLRSWRDGWRHLRFLLLHSPAWLYLYPGLALMLSGFGIQAALLSGTRIVGAIAFDIHTMLYGAAFSIVGFQMLWFSVFAHTIANKSGLLPQDKKFAWIVEAFGLEKGACVGGAVFAVGVVLAILAVQEWAGINFGELSPFHMMRWTIPSLTFIVCGVEMIIASFFIGVLELSTSQEGKPG